jgi:hypothetical protein
MAYENKQMQENMPAAESKKDDKEKRGAELDPKAGKNLFAMMKQSGEDKQGSDAGSSEKK